MVDTGERKMDDREVMDKGMEEEDMTPFFNMKKNSKGYQSKFKY